MHIVLWDDGSEPESQVTLYGKPKVAQATGLPLSWKEGLVWLTLFV